MAPRAAGRQRAPGARTRPGGYGVLLAALGVGVVIGAFTLSWLSTFLSPNRLLVFMGGQAIGSLGWGALATPLGITPVLVIAAAVSVRWLPMRALTGKLDRTTNANWPDPHLVFEPELDAGPVLVVKRYQVAPSENAAFLEAMDRVGLSRRRTGATRCGVPQTVA